MDVAEANLDELVRVSLILEYVVPRCLVDEAKSMLADDPSSKYFDLEAEIGVDVPGHALNWEMVPSQFHGLYRCDNCGHIGGEGELPEARDLLQRLEPGGVFTDRECPHCGSLCFPMGVG